MLALSTVNRNRFKVIWQTMKGTNDLRDMHWTSYVTIVHLMKKVTTAVRTAGFYDVPPLLLTPSVLHILDISIVGTVSRKVQWAVVGWLNFTI